MSVFSGSRSGKVWVAVAALLLLGAVSCATAAPAPPPTSVAVHPSARLNAGLNDGQDGITPLLATTLLRTGTQRVSFLLIGANALVQAPEATVTTSYLDGNSGVGDSGVSETTQAVFHLWPYAIRGAYSTELTFDQPGRWQLDISVDDAEFSGDTQLVLEVADQVIVPDIGAIPPKSKTKTLESEGGLKTLTTDFSPDPDLYLLSVEEAINDGKPAVIVFASPAFCTSPTCGPQVDTVAELKDEHLGEANFVHVEIYDNPEEIQGDLSQARITEAVKEWGFDQIPHWFNESWTYVLDSDGRVYQKFEGYVTLEELEEALQGVAVKG
ncbi:MAG: thioredoxin family protein [Chloroflexi bacterium]|nr:thioredoxin family protein [Chloroflexota bacterium]MDA1220277.1 thioredoxin family protein [Chloroflexota bacterium]